MKSSTTIAQHQTRMSKVVVNHGNMLENMKKLDHLETNVDHIKSGVKTIRTVLDQDTHTHTHECVHVHTHNLRVLFFIHFEMLS